MRVLTGTRKKSSRPRFAAATIIHLSNPRNGDFHRPLFKNRGLSLSLKIFVLSPDNDEMRTFTVPSMSPFDSSISPRRKKKNCGMPRVPWLLKNQPWTNDGGKHVTTYACN